MDLPCRDLRRSMLMTARSCQDLACCCSAISRDFAKHASASSSTLEVSVECGLLAGASLLLPAASPGHAWRVNSPLMRCNSGKEYLSPLRSAWVTALATAARPCSTRPALASCSASNAMKHGDHSLAPVSS